VIGASGERLTRNEAFDVVRRAVETLTTDDEDATRASAVRQRAREILGRDSESLNERMFIRILKDAHDAGVVDLRRRGDDFEVARAAEAVPVSEQVARADAASAPSRPVASPVAPRLGMGPRGAGGGRGRTRLEGPPPELLTLGIVEEPAAPAVSSAAVEEPRVEQRENAPVELPNVSEQAEPEPTPRRRGTGRKRGRATPVVSHPVQAAPAETEGRVAEGSQPAAARKSRAKTAAKTAHRRARARKTTPKSES
jgi:hypothetical protein